MRRSRVRVVAASTTSSLLLLCVLNAPGMRKILDASNNGKATRTFEWRNVFRGRGQLIVAVETQDAGVCGSC